MNPRQQPALAPLGSLHSGREAAAKSEAFVLERREREVDVNGRKPGSVGDVRGGGRAAHAPARESRLPCSRFLLARAPAVSRPARSERPGTRLVPWATAQSPPTTVHPQWSPGRR